jgi:hypothetical protein
MTFGNHEFIPIAQQHQQALLKYAAQFRLVRRDKFEREPSWSRLRQSRAPDSS